MSSPIPNSPSSAPSGSAKCPHCGRALSPNAPLGACPHCLLAAGIASEPAAPANSAPPPTPDELAPDFPQLDILELLGRGGMGAVYKARQKSLDRLVALKLLRPGLDADPSFADRFTREARALAQLNHPGIVTLYEFGRTESGRFFILMEFVDGLNLRQLLAAGRLSPREALAIVPPLCDALQYAHDRGLIHRDIKPENLLIDRLGRVKIADFGLAKLTATSAGRDGSPSPSETPAPALTSDTGHWSLVTGHSASDETAAGVLFGTPGYMAPEQRAHPSAVDHRADIYALGVVLYQLLTGELPDAQQLQAPSQRVHLDIRLDAIVLRALETNPALRFAAASELKTQIETIASSSPSSPQHPLSPSANPVNPENPVQKNSASPLFRASAISRQRLKFWLLRVAPLALLVLLALRFFVIAPYRIEGSSVEPEIPAGSLAFVYKLQRHFAPGDIVAYRHSESLTYVARVATAGPVNDQLFVTRKDQPPISVATSSIIGSVVFNTRNSRPRTSPPHDEKTKITPPSTPATRSSPSVESAAPRLDTLSQLPEPDPASITWTTTPDRTAEQPLLRIHASPGTDYKKIVALMDALKKSDFNRIAFDTLPEPQSQLPARAIPLPSETRQEILRLKIAEAKKLVSLAKTRVEAGVTTNEELHAAQDTVTILEAELLGDQSKIAQTKIAAAKRRFAVVSERHKIGNAWNDELHAAKDELALLEAELAHDPLKIAQIKVAAAKRRLDEATTRVETGTATDEVLSKAKTELAIRQLELNELLKTQPAK